jgi:hypothetical protein
MQDDTVLEAALAVETALAPTRPVVPTIATAR